MDSFGDLRGDNTPNPKDVKNCANHNLSIGIFGAGYTLEVKARKKYSKKAIDFDHRYWASIAENFGRQVKDFVKSSSKWPVPWKRPAVKRSKKKSRRSKNTSD